MRKKPYIFDTHCDVLYKMYQNRHLSFQDSAQLDVTYSGMKSSHYFVQCFAIFLLDDAPIPSMQEVRTCVDIYEQKIVSHPSIIPVRWREDLIRLQQGKEIGTILTMEGADVLHADIKQLEKAFQMGIRSLGLTWNYANWAADGVLEPRQAGLSLKGRELIHACNRIGMIIDISHLNESGFWEVIQLSSKPVIASHSNVYTVCPHPRNLKDEQIKAIIAIDGRIGITYVPSFTSDQALPVRVSDLLRHIEAVCTLGGSRHVGLGSDFDGTNHHIDGLENASQVCKLVDEIYRLYSADTAENILWKNWYRFFEQNLPVQPSQHR